MNSAWRAASNSACARGSLVRGRFAGGRLLGPLDLLAELGRVVLLAEHLHVAAQGQDADAVLRLAAAELPELQPADVEAQVELLALHAAELGDHEVAQLVDENDEPQADGDLEDGQPGFRVQ